MMHYNIKTPAIPERIRKEYHLSSLLSLHENAIVFSLEKKKPSSKKKANLVHPDPTHGVIKIIPKSYFDEDLFHTLQSLHHPLLLLPVELISEEEYVYGLYPRLVPLSEYLSRETLPLSKLIQLIKDMSQIISCLHDKNIIHGDIAPGNIYLDDEGHFYLGDFSSGRISSSRQSFASPAKSKKKTAATFPFSCGDYRQDIFSFLTILLNLLKACSSTDENNTAILSNLQDFIEELLLDLRKDKKYSFTFREVCQKILSAIEEDKKRHHLTSQDFLLSQEKLKFLHETTKPVKKNGFCASLLQKPKISAPIIALAVCSIIFLSAINYYGTDTFKQNKAYPPSDQILASENTIKDMGNGTSTLSPSEHASPTSTPIASPMASPTACPTVNQEDHSILDISGKKYQNIPSPSRTDSAVKIIFAQGNQMKKLSSFSSYPALEELYLDGNIISDLSNLPDFKHLAILGLSNNQVTNLSDLKTIASLKILDLSGQKNLSHFYSLRRFKNLDYLILTDTNATENDLRHLQQSLPQCMILY